MKVMVAKGGRHYHRPECPLIDKSFFDKPEDYDYYEVELDDVKSGKVVNNRGFKYIPCPCIFAESFPSPL